MTRRYARALVALTLFLAMSMPGAAGEFHGLTREHFGLIHPAEDGYGTALNDTTLSAAITGIGGAARTVLLNGAWTIANNLTIPENVVLRAHAGTVITVNAGRTLTVNGGFEAPLAQVFAGDGTIILGRRVETVHAQWFGAKFDDSTDDTAALQKALNVTDTSGNRTLKLPAGYARITSELPVPADVSIRGEGRVQSGIRVVGAIRGLVYDGDVNFEQSAVFEHFSVYGDYTQTLDLLTITGQSWGVRVKNMRLRGTAENAIALDETVGVVIEDNEISEFVKSGITSEDGFANRISIRNNRFEDYNAAHTVAAINCVGSSQWDITGNSFESALSTSLSALRLNGCANIGFEWNYAERYNHHLVTGVTNASQDISIRNNRMHTFAPHKLDFATDSLVHENIWVEHNHFDGVSDISIIFLRGSTATYRFVGNSRGTVEDPLEWIQGFPVTTKTVFAEPQRVYTAGLAVGDWTRKLFLNGASDLRLSNDENLSTITLHVGGTNAVVIEEPVVTFSAAVRPGSVAHAALPILNNGATIYCGDCNKAAPCTSGGTGAVAKRENGIWNCD